MSNLQMLQSMTAEAFTVYACEHGWCCPVQPDHAFDGYCLRTGCEQCWLDWLKMEASYETV